MRTKTLIALGFSVVALVNSWPSNDLRELENKLEQQIDDISFSSVGPSIDFMSSIAEIYCVDSQDNWYGGSGSIWINKGNYWPLKPLYGLSSSISIVT